MMQIYEIRTGAKMVESGRFWNWQQIRTYICTGVRWIFHPVKIAYFLLHLKSRDDAKGLMFCPSNFV